ncbi:hypothetical protein A2Z33_03710 [Candidatus Gottesmanbacteria bacterium RBG_16_52_11]|uniref:Amine oxidase domain-containing protein n=1 Tax=Candidatus Gottesmanbacteria bacterium RBG_16_52_11 TaxID=1798374 RepID=A0A1F5YVK3_9BACT|nr:MAG: hypothetical protein A2Z33_03710 [Candidatus Gottesmanbacteria bacterium RBG_16_52_11]
MKIAVIGGGFTGLSAALRLISAGHQVTLLEKEPVLGGLAHGFREAGWDWHLEFAYHHFFTNDASLIALAGSVGMERDLIIRRPVTATYVNGRMYQLDSPLSLLRFPVLPFTDRIRTGLVLAGAKLNPFWRPLERYTAETVFRTLGGSLAWGTIWQPLLYGKFGELAPTVAASWLWARIRKRTTRLGYIRGGFQTLVVKMADLIRSSGGIIRTGSAVTRIEPESGPGARPGFSVTGSGTPVRADRVLLTIPTPLVAKIVPGMPPAYLRPAETIPHLHAHLLILETAEPILNSVYWLNINDRSFPFLAAVAHTNFMDRSHYGNRHLTYFGNYLPPDHAYLKMDKTQVIELYTPFIRRLEKKFSPAGIFRSFMFTGPFAQPVHQTGYSARIPHLKTPLPGMYLANMDSIVPWDRGTNYAVELGQTAAQTILQDR